MTTSRTSRPTSQQVESNSSDALRWIRWGLEVLWLLTVILVPLAFLRISEEPLPLPSPMETAKVTLFRTLVGLMAILWVVELGLLRRVSIGLLKDWLASEKISPIAWIRRFAKWFRARPERWIVAAAVLYLAAVLISTILSVSISVSLWGRVPGTDTSGAYTVVCYFLLFSVIASHIKSRPQLWRLLGAVIGVGVLVGAYAAFQYYGQDFLQLANPGESRMRSTLGNPIFAAGLLLMTISVSVMVATITLSGRLANIELWSRACFWSVVIAVQLTGSVFTLSRGPWGGTLVALAAFLILGGLFLGRIALGRSALVLGMAAMLAAIAALVPTTLGWYQPVSGDNSAVEQIEGRFTSIQLEGTSSSLGQRLGIWAASGRVILRRPWFEFDDTNLNPLRQVVGYGPDFFTPAFMLGSVPVGGQLLPLETTHGHNYFIHNWVELGLLGLLAVVGLFLVPVMVGGWSLFQKRNQGFNVQKVLIIGLLALLAGRFVEQSVGVAKVSDLILFWVLLAVMVGVFSVISDKPVEEEAAGPTRHRPPRRRNRRVGRGASASGSAVLNVTSYCKWGVIALLIGGVITLTWVKNFTYVVALRQVAGLNQSFVREDLGAGLAMAKRATEIAPDVYQYRSAAGAFLSAYRSSREVVKEPECNNQAVDHRSYDICLAGKVYSNYSKEVALNPWRWRSRLDNADAALDLTALRQDGALAAEAIRLYRETIQMVPYSWVLRNRLANSYIFLGKPESALEVIEQSLAITGGTSNSAQAMYLRGLAFAEMDQLPGALAAYDEAIRLDPEHAVFYNSRGNIYDRNGEYQLAIADYNEAIRIDPENAEAFDSLGNTYSQLAQYPEAIASYDAAIQLLPGYARAYNNRGNAYVLLGRHDEAIADFDQALDLNPNYAIAYASRALAYTRVNLLDEARQDVERAVALGVERTLLESEITKLQAQASGVTSGR